jgi:hypothetical protein
MVPVAELASSDQAELKQVLAEIEVQKQQRGRRSMFAFGFAAGMSFGLATLVAVFFLVVTPKTKAAIASATTADDVRLLTIVNDADGVFRPMPADSISAHEWVVRRTIASLAAYKVSSENSKRALQTCGLALSSVPVQRQADSVVAAGGVNSANGRRELGLLLDLVRPGLGRLVVLQ